MARKKKTGKRLSWEGRNKEGKQFKNFIPVVKLVVIESERWGPFFVGWGSEL